MFKHLKIKLLSVLRWSEQYVKTDMYYVAKGGFWLVLCQLGIALTAFVFSIAVAYYLPPALYGSYKYVLSLVAIISAFSLTGLGTTILRQVARGDEMSLPKGFSRSFITSIPMFFGFMGVSGYYLYQGDFVLSLAIFVAGIATPIINSASLYNAYWNGKKDFFRHALYWSLANILSTGAVIATLPFTDHIGILLGVFFSISALANISFYILTFRAITSKISKETPKDTKDAFHQSVINFLNTIAGNIDKIIIFQFIGTIQLAIYSFALAVPDQIRNMLKIGARLALPRFAEQTFTHIQQSLGGKMLRFGALIVVMIVAYIVVAPYLFQFLFPAYVDSIPYSQLLALSLIGVMGTAPLSALQAHAKHRALYIHAIVSNVIQIVSTIVLALLYGLWGAVIALLANRLLALALPWLLLKNSEDV